MKTNLKISIRNIMKPFLPCLAAYGLWLVTASAQVPVTVSRSIIQSGGSVNLPSFSGGASAGTAEGSDLTYISGAGYFPDPAAPIASVTGSAFGSPSILSGAYNYAVFISASLTVTFATNAPNTFTNTLVAGAGWHAIDHGGNSTGIGGTISQTYAFTVIDGTGDNGVMLPTATLTGQSDPLESISRKDTSTAVRKLLGFQLTATTNAVLTGFAVAISNTTTNGNPVEPIGFYRAAESNQVFDASATLLATTTNTGGFAIFTGLAEPITGTNQAYFIAGNFSATNQTRDSFIAASLNSQNITATLTGTNAAMIVNGGSFLGKQYAFLDATQAEDDAAAAALAAQINASVTGATNAQAAAFNSQLAAATNAQASAFAAEISTLGNTTTGLNSTSSKDKSNLMNTILPAAAAGAAGIGAAFTSDSLHQGTLSREYQINQRPTP